jgi:hypothetical protein
MANSIKTVREGGVREEFALVTRDVTKRGRIEVPADPVGDVLYVAVREGILRLYEEVVVRWVFVGRGA